MALKKTNVKMFVKRISKEDFQELPWRVVNISLRMRTMTVSERFPAILLGG